MVGKSINGLSHHWESWTINGLSIIISIISGFSKAFPNHSPSRTKPRKTRNSSRFAGLLGLHRVGQAPWVGQGLQPVRKLGRSHGKKIRSHGKMPWKNEKITTLMGKWVWLSSLREIRRQNSCMWGVKTLFSCRFVPKSSHWSGYPHVWGVRTW